MIRPLAASLCHASAAARRAASLRLGTQTSGPPALLGLRPSLRSIRPAPARLAASLWPFFLYLLPLGLVGRVEQGGPLWLMLPAFASVLLGAYLAHKGGAMA